MAVSEDLLTDLAGAILDGAPIDWETAESSADDTERALLAPLKRLSTLADLHRALQLTHTVSKHTSPEAERKLTDSATSPHGEGSGKRLEHWGHLRVVELIGRGAFGEVYRAWDTRLDREVALKLLAAPASGDPPATSIIEEGRLLARVRHSNVVTIYGADRIDRRIGLWMEFVRGRTLEQLLQQGHVFDLTEIVRIGIDLCAAVAAVHDADLLHRDIKAHNVMIANDGRVVLMDFGTGRELGDRSDGLAGTPLYLAPELFCGGDASVRSDIYSLGVLLYHLATGSYPVLARRVDDLRLAHERDDRADVNAALGGVSPKLARIIERALDPQPERRYRSAHALEADLATLKSRPPLVRLARAMGLAAVLTIFCGVAWETAGRQLGSARTPSALLAGVAVLGSGPSASVIERPVVAVLPFKNLGAEPDGDYLVDGLTEEVIRNLSTIDGLAVRSSTSSFAFKNKTQNAREVGRQLNANLVLEASVLRVGTHLRINARLVRAADDVALWSGRLEREQKDIFAIQHEIGRSIAKELRLQLGQGQRRYDTDVRTYEQYLKARALANRHNITDSKGAAKLFTQIITKDPAFAPAYAGLADAYARISIGDTGVTYEAAHAVMRPAAVAALRLDSLSAEAHAAMGLVYARELDWGNAERSFLRAIELDPALTHIHVNYSVSTLRPLGKFDEAERLLEEARRSDPLSLELQKEIGQVQFTAGRYDEAVVTFQRVRAVDPSYPLGPEYLQRALTFSGRLAEALVEPGDREAGGREGHYRAHTYVRAGRRADAERMARRVRSPYPQAVIYAALRDKDRTFAALEQVAVNEPQRVPLALSFPEFAVLRDDPRFAALRKRFRLP